MYKEVKFDNDCKASLRNGILIASKAVGSTLGPKGRTVIIEGLNSPHVTKDGVTVARALNDSDHFTNIGIQLIKEVASKTCNDVGDGTTTSSVLAQALIEYSEIEISKGINPVKLKKELEDGIKIVTDFIKSQAIPIDQNFDLLEQVASISANNDNYIGVKIREIFDEITSDGIIIVEESKNNETYSEIVKGMRFDRGYIAPQFIFNNVKMESIIDDVLILITNDKIRRIEDIIDIIEYTLKESKSLLIIAEDYESMALEALKANVMQLGIKIIPVKAPSFGEFRNDVLQDIAVLTNGSFINVENSSVKNASIQYLGSCEKVIVNKNNTTIIGGNGNKDKIDDRILSLKTLLEDTEISDFSKNSINERISKLRGGLGILHVGGYTEIEMRERKDRVDDAVAATKAAIEEGVIAGGGSTYVRAAEKLDANITGHKVLIQALYSPILKIAENAGVDINPYLQSIIDTKNLGYDANSEECVDMISCGILDPVKVSRMAIENAMSIASLYILTNCMIVNKDELIKF